MLYRLRAYRGGGSPLPSGALVVGSGLVVNGIATYGFLTIARNSLGEAAYDPLAALWAMTFILGPGFFQPLEQEVARATAFRAARGLGSAPVLRRAVMLGAGLLSIVTLCVLIAWPLKLSDTLEGNGVLLLSLLMALPAFWLSFPIRGLLAGRKEFGRYGVYFGVEGMVRLVPAMVFAAFELSTGAFGLVVGLAPLIAAGVAVAGERPLARPGPPAPWAEVSESLGLLLAASLFTNLLLNVGPVAVKILADEQSTGATGAFLNGVIIARIPLFFFQAVQASLIPQLAGFVSEHRLDDFTAVLNRLIAAVLSVAVVGIIGAAATGPVIVRTVFGDDLSSREMALLAAASGGFMLAMSFASALIALHRLERVVLGWFSGVVTFPIVVALIDDLFLRVALGLAIGSGMAALVMAGLLYSRLAIERSGDPMAPGPVGGGGSPIV